MNFAKAVRHGVRVAKSLASHKVYKFGPAALIVAGIAFDIAGTVEAVKASDKEIDGRTGKEEVAKYKDNLKLVRNSHPRGYSRVKAEVIETVRFLKTQFKRYIWTIVCMAAGCICIFGSHKIMLNRVAQAGAIVTALTQDVHKLEDSVRAHCPEDLADAILQDAQKVVKSEVVKDPETKEVKQVKHEEVVTQRDLQAPWNIWISQETCPYVNFIESNRAETLFDFKNIEVQMQQDLGKYHCITAWDLLQELRYRTDLLSPEEKERCRVIGIYERKGSEPSKYVDFGLGKDGNADFKRWARGDADGFYLRVNWDGYVANR